MPRSTNALDLGAVARKFDAPFRHIVFGENTLLSPAEVDRLVATFPGHGVTTVTRRSHGSDKTYDMRTATLYRFGVWSPAVAGLDESWRTLLSWLVDSDYRTELAGLLDLPREQVELEIRVSEYTDGGWMSRHTDRPEKLFSQNFYLCPGWSPDWGGGLALYDTELTAEPAVVFVPGAGSSVAFARSDRSWHEVVTVAPHAGAPRRAVLVHGYRHASDAHEERDQTC